MLIAHFLKEIYIGDEYYDDGADLAYIPIDKELYTRIKEAQEVLNKTGWHKMMDFDSTPVFKDKLEDEDGYEDTIYSAENLSNLSDNEEMRVDTLQISVSNTGVMWVGYLKHTSVEVSTDSIDIEELDENFKVIDAKREDLPLFINNLAYDSSKVLLTKRLSQ
jgi:hypothetical protein